MVKKKFVQYNTKGKDVYDDKIGCKIYNIVHY